MRVMVWRVLGGVVLVLLVAACWVGYRGWQVQQALSDTTSAASALQHAVTSDDPQGQDRALTALRSSAGDARRLTDGVTWSMLTHAPVVGDDARGVQVVADVVDQLGKDGVEPLLSAATDLQGILPKAGRIPVATVRSLQQPIGQADEAFATADRQLRDQDSSGFVSRLAVPYRDLATKVADASDLLSSADRAVSVLPGMLGGDQRRNYLLVVQNNAEIRSTGGLPGSVSLLTADHGKVRLARQVAGNSFGELPEPVLPLTEAELAIYHRQLGTYFLDANFTPDFPRASELWRARWQQVYPEHIDGVVALDPVTLSYLLKVTGPIDAGPVTLTPDNAVDELLHQVYVRYRDPTEQDRFFQSVAQQIFARISSGVESPRDLITALARAADEHRIYVHSFDDRVQRELTGSEVAGELVTDTTTEPQVGVYLDDATGAKMSYYLRYHAQVNATYCQVNAQGLSGHLTLKSVAPEDAATLPPYITGGGSFNIDPGSQFVLVRLYGPVDGRITQIQLGQKAVTAPQVVDQQGRPVTTVPVELAPGQVADVDWRMVTGRGQTGDTAVSVTPSVTATQSSSVARSACS